MMDKDEILLASGSVQRKAILEELGIGYRAVAMEVEEVTRATPSETVLENARRKLLAALPLARRGQAVLAADTVVWAQGQILGKPETPERARDFLRKLSGQVIEAHSGVALAVGGEATAYCCAERAAMTMKTLSAAEIEWYVSTREPLIRAGAIGISHYGEVFVSRIDGSYSCIAGLPKAALLAAMGRSPSLAAAMLPTWAQNRPLPPLSGVEVEAFAI